MKNNLTGLLGMIWKIRFWNIKKIGKKNFRLVADMIATFRAFATSVSELKIQTLTILFWALVYMLFILPDKDFCILLCDIASSIKYRN